MRWNTLSAYRLNASCLHVRRPASQFLEVCPEERNICLDFSGSLREQTIRGGVCIPSHAKYLCKETAKIRCPINVNGFQPRGPFKFGSFSPIEESRRTKTEPREKDNLQFNNIDGCSLKKIPMRVLSGPAYRKRNKTQPWTVDRTNQIIIRLSLGIVNFYPFFSLLHNKEAHAC
ncbi:hypothetical protein QQP08_001030 [Theobroma cacao]|nr:hypothetical protein QQP08_001030 [Theobroma cacao]